MDLLDPGGRMVRWDCATSYGIRAGYPGHIYGARAWASRKGKPPKNLVWMYKRMARQDAPDWDPRWGVPPCVEDMHAYARRGMLTSSWAHDAPEGLSSEAFLRPKNHYSRKRGDHMCCSGFLGSFLGSSIPNLWSSVNVDE